MTLKGEVRLDVNTQEAGAAVAAEQLEKVNAQVDKFSKTELDSTINLLQRAGSAISALWAFAREGEAALNIQRAFAAQVRDSAAAMTSAQAATRGLFDETTLQQRILAMDRMNLSIGDQSRLLEAMTKITVTTGKGQEEVFTKLLDAVNGSKESLKDFGIVLDDTAEPLAQVDKALSKVNLDDFATASQRAEVAWADFTSSVQSDVAEMSSDFEGFFGARADAALAVIDDLGTAVKEQLDPALVVLTKQIERAGNMAGNFGQNLQDVKEGMEAAEVVAYARFLESTTGLTVQLSTATQNAANAFANMKTEAELAALAAGGAFAAAPGPVGKQLSAFEARALTKETTAPRKKRRGRRRRGEDPVAAAAELETSLLLQEQQAAIDIFEGEQEAAAQRRLEQAEAEREALELTHDIETQRLQTALALGEIKQDTIIAAEREMEIQRIGLELIDGRISAEQALGQEKIANLKAEQQMASFSRAANAQAKAQAAQSQASMMETIGMTSQVISLTGQAASAFAKNQKEQAAITAVMSVINATMAGIRIIADMGVVGIPLAAATLALGIANAAQAASFSGGGAAPTAPGAFGGGGGGFQTQAIGERPELGAAPVVLNINAPVIGGTAQEIAARLNDFGGDDGGMRPGAA